MSPTLKSRARGLAELHADVMVALSCAAAGKPERLLNASWKGHLDTDIACLMREIERER